MPLTKCSHDDYAAADILQLQSMATVATTTSASITATATTTIRRRWQQLHQQHQFQLKNNNVCDVQQPQQLLSYPVRQQPCNDFLCCRAHCHHHYRHLHHHVEQQQQTPTPPPQQQQQHFQSHPVHSHQLADYHHYQRRQSSVFPLNTPTALPPPSLSYSLLSANAGKVCSISRTTAVGGGGGGTLCLASSGRKLQLVIFILLNLLLRTCCGQLLINVQNQGGEVIQESITSNISEDLITLEFQKTDGTYITQIIDFRNEVRILKALVLGEEERGQNLYQVMCFITKFTKGDFISSDAMAKLRQKNPSTIRTPEEDKGKDTFIMTSWVHLNRSQPISRHLMTVCGEAIDATYVRDVDLKAWSELPGSSISSLEAATEKFPDTLSSRCNEVSSLWAPCICTLETCIGWYPCGLKYCKGKATAGGDSSAAAAAAASNYRCGIKTCRRCSQFSYYVRQKQQCLWDE